MSSSTNHDGPNDNNGFELTIRLVSGTRFPVVFSSSSSSSTITVQQLKESIANDAKNEHRLPVDQQRLIYKGRILEDVGKTLADYGITESQSIVFMVKKASQAAIASVTGATAAAASASTTAAASGSNSTSSSSADAATNDWLSSLIQQQQPRQQLLQQARQQLAQQQQEGQQQTANTMNPFGGMGMPTPQQQEQMLQSPFFQGLADNPDLLARLLQVQFDNNPQLQRLLEEQPALRQMMEDPSTLQQLAQMMRHPQAMQQAMRQQDLALSQLENMPGGFAALSSLYHNIQEPLQESMTPGEEGASSTGRGAAGSASSRSSAEAGASGAAMPNPWGSPRRASNNSSTTASATSSGNQQRLPPWAGFPTMPGMMGAPPVPPAPSSSSVASTSGTTSTVAANNPWAHLSSSQPSSNTTSSPSASGTANSNSHPPNPLLSSMFGGAGGGIPPNLGGANAAASMMNPEAALQLLDDPFFSRMMTDAVNQNPDSFRMALEQRDPMFAAMFGNDPQAGNQFVRSMFNPQMLRTMLQLQQQQGLQPGQPPGAGPTLPGGMTMPHNFDWSSLLGGAGAPGPGGANSAAGVGGMDFGALLRNSQALSEQMQQMQQQLPSMAASVPAPQRPSQQQPPEQRYARQLQQLQDMGFDHRGQNIDALQRVSGNLNRAVDMLLNGEVPIPAVSASTNSATASTSAAATQQFEPTSNTSGTFGTRQRRGAGGTEGGDSESGATRMDTSSMNGDTAGDADSAMPDSNANDAAKQQQPKDTTEKKND